MLVWKLRYRYRKLFRVYRGEATKSAHLSESASLKKKFMNKNYEKICIESLNIFSTLFDT